MRKFNTWYNKVCPPRSIGYPQISSGVKYVVMVNPTIGQKFWKIERGLDGAPESISKLVFIGYDEKLSHVMKFSDRDTDKVTSCYSSHWNKDYYDKRADAYEKALEDLDAWKLSRENRIKELISTKHLLEAEQNSSNF